MIKLDELMARFGHRPLSELRHDTVFHDAISQTGENKALTLSRRYTVDRPRIEIHAHEKEVDILSISGFNKSTSLFTIERVEYKRDTPYLLMVNDSNTLLKDLEPQINAIMGIQGWVWTDDKRNKPVRDFLTKEAKYHADLQVVADTLSTYADFTLRVMLDYVDIEDAIRGLAHVYPREKDQPELTIEEVNLMTLPAQAMSYAHQYKAMRDSLPFITNTNHI